MHKDVVYFKEEKISLKPEQREYDFGVYYMREKDDYDWRMALIMRTHPDHMADVKPDFRALFGLSFKF